MLRFSCDYQEGAHPRILQRLMEINETPTPGYGEDDFCAEAARIIREKCAAPQADVHFLVGGTQTNFTFLSASLRPYQGVIAAETAHIATHETGSVEARGHKVLALPSGNGKLSAEQVSEYCRLHFSSTTREHMVMPKAVYVSNSTELGGVYTRRELAALREACDRWNLFLYMDGAWLGYALASAENDLDLPAIAELCDAFYIGGTKQGALFGEALVLLNDELKRDFRYCVKQNGGMLAKGWLLGVQFAELLRDDLYMELSTHAVEQAMRLKRAFQEKGYPFLMDSPTNQQFPILPDAHLQRLAEEYAFSEQERVDDSHRAVRFCTSWSTRAEDVDRLIESIRAL